MCVRNSCTASAVDQEKFLLSLCRCMPVSSCSVWLCLWGHTRKCCSLSFAGAYLCRQVLQDRPLVSDSDLVLGKENMYFAVARPEGVIPLRLIFILSSLEECKPCLRGCECVWCVSASWVSSIEALVFRKLEIGPPFSLWTAQSNSVNLHTQMCKQEKINSP